MNNYIKLVSIKELEDIIQNCIENEKNIILYYLNKKGKFTIREVTPLEIGEFEYEDYEFYGLRGFCHLRKEERYFVFERIYKLVIKSNKEEFIYVNENFEEGIKSKEIAYSNKNSILEYVIYEIERENSRFRDFRDNNDNKEVKLENNIDNKNIESEKKENGIETKIETNLNELNENNKTNIVQEKDYKNDKINKVKNYKNMYIFYISYIFIIFSIVFIGNILDISFFVNIWNGYKFLINDLMGFGSTSFEKSESSKSEIIKEPDIYEKTYIELINLKQDPDFWKDKKYRTPEEFTYYLYRNYGFKYESDEYRHGDDYIQHPLTTLYTRRGDCDDFTILLMYFFRIAYGISANFVTVHDVEDDSYHALVEWNDTYFDLTWGIVYPKRIYYKKYPYMRFYNSYSYNEAMRMVKPF